MECNDNINNTNPYGKPAKDSAEAKQEKLIVEAVENYCSCHQTITLRCRDRYHWIHIFVKAVPDVSFGDMVLAPCDKDGFFLEGNYYLYYNRKLMYRLQCEDFPPELIEKVVNESAARMYPDEE